VAGEGGESGQNAGAAVQAAEIEGFTKDRQRAEEVFQQARERLFEHESVQAKMSQLVSLGEYKFRSSGAYLAGEGFKYRLEYQVELADLQGSFLEVSDGQILHTRKQITQAEGTSLTAAAAEVELTRRDIQRILRETRENLDVPEALHAAEIGLGGLPAILASLERSMTFDAVREQTLDGRDYTVLQGAWDEERRDELMEGLGGVAGQIAGFMPDLVRVYFERETLFPERFVYLKLISEERQSYRPMLTIEFTEVKLGESLPAQAFIYVAPPGMEERDETAFFLQMIRSAAQGAPPAEVVDPVTPVDPTEELSPQ
jgi:outer membrane lipoprotein-sorting protein